MLTAAAFGAGKEVLTWQKYSKRIHTSRKNMLRCRKNWAGSMQVSKRQQNLADAEYLQEATARRWALPFASYSLTYLHGQGSHPAVLLMLFLFILWLTNQAVVSELRMLPSSKTMICMVGYICFCCIYSLAGLLGLTSEGWDLTVVSNPDVVPMFGQSFPKHRNAAVERSEHRSCYIYKQQNPCRSRQ